MGEGGDAVQEIHPQVMKQGVLYNVKQGAWHAVAVSRDATILLVENRDTARENSDYYDLNPGQRQSIVRITAREIPEWQALNE
jgi:hypothetical protein